MRCIVKDCVNQTHKGAFVGELCAPCYEYITTGKGKYSQAYRNSIKVAIPKLILTLIKIIEETI